MGHSDNSKICCKFVWHLSRNWDFSIVLADVGLSCSLFVFRFCILPFELSNQNYVLANCPNDGLREHYGRGVSENMLKL